MGEYADYEIEKQIKQASKPAFPCKFCGQKIYWGADGKPINAKNNKKHWCDRTGDAVCTEK